MPMRVNTNEYRTEQDGIAAFLNECCHISVNAVARASLIYERYKAWCEENNERVLSQRLLGGKLTEKGFASRHGTGGYKVWCGVGVLRVEEVNEVEA